MESQPLVCMPPRKFQQISVGKCHAQTATERFGDGAKIAIRDRERASLGMHPQSAEMPFTWPGLDSDDEQDSGSSIYKLIPSMQKFRNNLTALSQSYNLYFVAYQGRIFVYRPRSVPTQALPRRPDLQLAPKPTAAAREIGGFLDIRRPHLVNNLVTGYLGREEIVVACYDDGDVIAYYVKEVAEQVSSRRGTAGSSPRGTPRLFFHENVGISAWGLAVHQKSRLIAVSSNRHEVTVFAFGLTTKRAVSKVPSYVLSSKPDANVRRRARNWRIVVLLGSSADNCPNICFVDDEEGYADKICAIDIKGAIWLAAIWKACQPPIYIAPLCHPQLKSEEFYPAPSRGWGVLALPESSFIHVRTPEELFGLPVSQIHVVHEPPGRGGQPLINVRKVLNDIPGNPCRLPSAAFATIVLNQLPPMFFPGQPLEAQEVGALLADFSDGGEEEFGDLDAESDEGGADEMDDDEDDDDGEDDEENGQAGDDDGDDDSDDPDNEGDTDNDMDAPGPADMAHVGVLHAWDSTAPIGVFGETHLNGGLDAGLTGMNGTVAGNKSNEVAGGRSHGHTRVLDNRPLDSFPSPLDMTYFPHHGVVHETPRKTSRLLAFLRRPTEYNTRPRENEQAMAKYGNKLHLLRTYEKDIEMRGFWQSEETGMKEVGVLCPDALNFGHFRDQGLRHHFHATSRLNMIAHAPELGLVVIGSPTGRVVLLTLTRMAVPTDRPEGVWEHGFRVEWVLPTREDEDAHRKVLRPLHGMAMGPVQVEGGEEIGGSAALPRKYRLMLHYRNHDILSYEITREEQSGKLCIF